MKPPTLSPEAQRHVDELARPAYYGDFASDYHAMIRKLVDRDTSDITEWEIKGQGIEVLEKSREEHRVAVELKAYAIHQLELLRLLELDGSPESPPMPLDEFLKKAMPNTGRDVLRERFMRFLIEKADSEVDEQMELHPRPDISRDERVKQMSAIAFALVDQDGVAGPTGNIYGPWFRNWWKRHEGNNLSSANGKKAAKKSDRHKALVELLPSRNNKPGQSKDEWRSQAEKKGLFSSLRTFNNDVKTLIDSRLVHVQDDGNFRQLAK